jgi:phage anti-repressor protein
MMREEEKTPIEIALGVDEEGMTTAKKLYAFLELHSNNYSRWLKKNIRENIFAEEGVDFFPLAKKGERSISAFEANQQSADYKLTSSFAKKLAMSSQTRKGQEVLEYYVQVEQFTKELTSVVVN